MGGLLLLPTSPFRSFGSCESFWPWSLPLVTDNGGNGGEEAASPFRLAAASSVCCCRSSEAALNTLVGREDAGEAGRLPQLLPAELLWTDGDTLLGKRLLMLNLCSGENCGCSAIPRGAVGPAAADVLLMLLLYWLPAAAAAAAADPALVVHVRLAQPLVCHPLPRSRP